MIPKKTPILTTKALVEAKAVALIRILIQNQTTKVAATKKRKVDLIQTVRLNIVNKRFPFKKPILSRYDVKDNVTFQIC